MKEYAHIDTIWKRDERGQIIEGDFACDEFAFLANCEWVGTEKVDGTNVRIMWNGERVTFGGKTDNAQMPTFLLARLQDLFADLGMFTAKFGEGPVCLYGEGYGARIQKGGGNYNPNGVDFVLFDVKVGDWWLKREGIEDVAEYFGLSVVPIVFRGTLLAAAEEARHGIQSLWGEFAAEGLVLKPSVDLVKRNHERIIAKIKSRDYSRRGSA